MKVVLNDCVFFPPLYLDFLDLDEALEEEEEEELLERMELLVEEEVEDGVEVRRRLLPAALLLPLLLLLLLPGTMMTPLPLLPAKEVLLMTRLWLLVSGWPMV